MVRPFRHSLVRVNCVCLVARGLSRKVVWQAYSRSWRWRPWWRSDWGCRSDWDCCCWDCCCWDCCGWDCCGDWCWRCLVRFYKALCFHAGVVGLVLSDCITDRAGHRDRADVGRYEPRVTGGEGFCWPFRSHRY
jgi:hypothetical protein